MATKSKMIGRFCRHACGCCTDDTKVRTKRKFKRRERAAFRREVASLKAA